jgi:hypothetical protein
MPYDEYEISLGRELELCEQYVRKYERIAACQGAFPATESSSAREQAVESLRLWSGARDEYARLLKQLQTSR